MKKISKAVILYCIFGLCIIIMSGVNVDASKATDAKKAYMKKIARMNDSTYSYRIMDLDNNKIPELIYCDGAAQIVYTYNAKTKKVKKLATAYNATSGPWVSKNKHSFIILAHTSGMSRYMVYKVKGSKAKKSHVYEYYKVYQNPPKNNYWIHKIDNKKVSEKTLNKKLGKTLKAHKDLDLWREAVWGKK